jgi:hypothetical protein
MRWLSPPAPPPLATFFNPFLPDSSEAEALQGKPPIHLTMRTGKLRPGKNCWYNPLPYFLLQTARSPSLLNRTLRAGVVGVAGVAGWPRGAHCTPSPYRGGFAVSL